MPTWRCGPDSCMHALPACMHASMHRSTLHGLLASCAHRNVVHARARVCWWPRCAFGTTMQGPCRGSTGQSCVSELRQSCVCACMPHVCGRAGAACNASRASATGPCCRCRPCAGCDLIMHAPTYACMHVGHAPRLGVCVGCGATHWRQSMPCIVSSRRRRHTARWPPRIPSSVQQRTAGFLVTCT